MAAGRPTKLTPKFLQIAEDILNYNINAIILTDEELRDLINDKLSEEERVSVTRWEEWKAGNMKDPIVNQFRGLIKKALTIQKINLFEKLQTDDKAWQRYAWIIERKFSDWNLRKIEEHTGKDGGPMEFQVTNLLKEIDGSGESIPGTETEAK